MQKLNEICMKLFHVDEEELPTLEMNVNKYWDSLEHMKLIIELEQAYNLKFTVKEIINLKSYKKLKERLCIK